MSNKKLYTSLFCLSFIFTSLAQSNNTDSTLIKTITGVLLDENTLAPLPYANVAVLAKNKGATTNEKGFFVIKEVDKSDTLSFHYIGYELKKIAVNDIQKGLPIYLKEEIFSLNEFFVFANNHNAENIVKNVIKYKERNYKSTAAKKQLFIRKRYISNVDKININFKKSSFTHLDEKMTKLLEKKIPKQSISYTDFLGDVYTSNNKEDTLKLNPIKVVSLKEKDVADLEQLEKRFIELFSNTKENEYWKIKSGIIGGKLDVKGSGSVSDIDSLSEFYKNHLNVKVYAKRLHTRFNNLLEDKKKWDFLYHTGNYEYTLVGGTKVNGEDVYIIDFKPKKGGKVIGRVYIAIDTYALVKADFKYDVGKTGTDIHLFGVGYTSNQLNISIYFEKKEGNYQLKYYAQKIGNKVSFDRNVSLIKKRKRFLIDKELNEIKVRLNILSREESSFEVLILDDKKISNQTYANFKQKSTFKIIYVDQFNDNVWNGYDIIEPTKQMRDYKKIE
ncbi:MAG: carboxypeptidase-like regulatory domain-containing protein [Vicingus serpentipes]|nr:carboxypeptidase-like regulatory domain-containing protein [Vicingus serpentipes]